MNQPDLLLLGAGLVVGLSGLKWGMGFKILTLERFRAGLGFDYLQPDPPSL